MVELPSSMTYQQTRAAPVARSTPARPLSIVELISSKEDEMSSAEKIRDRSFKQLTRLKRRAHHLDSATNPDNDDNDSFATNKSTVI